MTVVTINGPRGSPLTAEVGWVGVLDTLRFGRLRTEFDLRLFGAVDCGRLNQSVEYQSDEIQNGQAR